MFGRQLCWATLTWKLQDSYDVCMADTRGHGSSDPLTSADDGDTQVKDVVEFVRAMNSDKLILMGHSMGAATSEAWQAMSPTMVTGDSSARIPAPAPILKADACPEIRLANEEAAQETQDGKLAHVDGAAHKLHHDELERTVEPPTEFPESL